VPKTARDARVTTRANRSLRDPAHARGWLREPKPSSGDRPMQLLATKPGSLAFEEQLIGIEHGMFA
jgi:uncharacterized protein (DUF2384 family)